MRIILYTGKGGVGKTSIAASTSIKLAREGKKVLIMSTDQAHSLADSFAMKLTYKPIKIIENLDAMEVDVVVESETAWGEMQGFIKDIIASRSDGGIEAEELLIFPGLEELFALFKILDFYDENKYDVIIVDCAPTGETLSLLKFPEMFGTMIDTVLPMKRKAVKTAGPLLQKITHIPMPKESFFDEFEKLFDKLARLQELMLNKEVMSLRIVTTPEKIVIKETKRNFTCLHLYDYNVDAIIVNKIYPKEALVGYFNRWVTLQEEGLLELQESFRDIPMFRLMLQKQELKTVPILEEISTLYGDVDPSKVLFTKKIFNVIMVDNNYRLEVYLPFVEKSEMELGQKNGEIQIAIRNEKRCFLLPAPLQGKQIIGAKMDGGILGIDFA